MADQEIKETVAAHPATRVTAHDILTMAQEIVTSDAWRPRVKAGDILTMAWRAVTSGAWRSDPTRRPGFVVDLSRQQDR